MRPIITRRPNGEYSTVRIGDRIETRFFPDDRSESTLVGITITSVRTSHDRHIADHERANGKC